MLIEKLKVTIAITLVISFWSLVVPIFEFPDEQAHVESVEFLVKNGRMPKGEEWDMTKEMAETQKYLGVYRDNLGNNKVTYHPEYRLEYTNSYIGKHEQEIVKLKENREEYVNKEAARYPRLYYDLVGFANRFVADSDIFTRVYVMRLANVLFAILTAYYVYKLGQQLFNSQRYATLLTVLMMLQPMYSFLSAGINSDNLHNLLFAMITYIGYVIVHDGLTLRNLGGIGAILFLDFLTKPQAYIALPIILVAYLIHIVSHKKWQLLKIILLLGVVALALVISPLNPYRSWVLSSNLHNASFVDFLLFSLNKLVAQNMVWYWGVFKWLGVVLPPIYWQVANRLIMIAGLGIVVYYYRILRKRQVIVPPMVVSYLLAVVIIYTIAIYYFDWQYVKAVGYSIGVQARYLFPTIAAQMALLIVGISSLVDREWYRRLSYLVLGLFMIWMQLGGIWRLFTSYYDVSSLQVFITQASQYKPSFAKGDWWYLWILLYLGSIAYLAIKVLTTKETLKVIKK